MDIVSGIVVFMIVWWTIIFCVLPLGMSSTQEIAEEDEYLAPGAPKNVNIKQKFILTTFITIAVWIVIYVLIEIEIINFIEIADALF